MRKATDMSMVPPRREGFSARMVVIAILAILLHATFLVFKKTPDTLMDKSARLPRVALLPLGSKSADELKLLKWMDILNPSCFIKPDRIHGFSITPGTVHIEDMPLRLKDHPVDFSAGNIGPLPVPTESGEELLRKLWCHESIPVTEKRLIREIRASDYPLWLLENNSRLPQLFADPAKVRDFVAAASPRLAETVLIVRFLGTEFFPEVRIERSCGNAELDTMAVKALAFRGGRLELNDKRRDAPFFLSIKWKPTFPQKTEN